jgi:hypothetical protein
MRGILRVKGWLFPANQNQKDIRRQSTCSGLFLGTAMVPTNKIRRHLDHMPTPGVGLGRTTFIARRGKGLFRSHFWPGGILPTVHPGPSGAHQPTVYMQN